MAQVYTPVRVKIDGRRAQPGRRNGFADRFFGAPVQPEPRRLAGVHAQHVAPAFPFHHETAAGDAPLETLT